MRRRDTSRRNISGWIALAFFPASFLLPFWLVPVALGENMSCYTFGIECVIHLLASAPLLWCVGFIFSLDAYCFGASRRLGIIAGTLNALPLLLVAAALLWLLR